MMSDEMYQLKRISNRTGVVLVAMLIAFFLLMNSLGLGHNYWLRSLNFVFVFAMIYSSIRSFKLSSSREYYEEFFDLFKIGMRTSLIGIGIFSVFLIAYLGILDPVFMEELRQYESMGAVISPISVAFLIFLEGMGSSFVCTYMAIQLQKSRTVEMEVESARS